MVQPAWPEDTIRSLQLSEFDERFRRYRLSPPEAEREIIDSLRRYGQIAPVVWPQLDPSKDLTHSERVPWRVTNAQRRQPCTI
jgi:hypothetical protein